MAVNLDATPGGLSANSYASVAEADTYVDSYVLEESNRDLWLDQDTDDKARLLIQATRQIDWYYSWYGRRMLDEQALEWPRYYVYREHLPLPYNEVPLEIKHGVIEMALWLIAQQDSTPVDGPFQLDEVAVGSIRVNFNTQTSGQSKVYMPDKVASLVGRYGVVTPPEVPMGGQARNIRLVRT